jgi:hypothetical protein
MKKFGLLHLLCLACVLLFGCSGGDDKSLTKGPVTDPLAKLWATSTDVVYEVTKDNFEKKLKPVHQASLSLSNDKMVIQSTGDDPYLHTTEKLDLKRPGRYLLKVRLSAPANTQTQIFFGRPDTPFRENDSKTVNVSPGWNDIFFEVPQPETIVQLRLDPGTVAGLYGLEEFAVKRLSQ